jgi:hypothetical protein
MCHGGVTWEKWEKWEKLEKWLMVSLPFLGILTG